MFNLGMFGPLVLTGFTRFVMDFSWRVHMQEHFSFLYKGKEKEEERVEIQTKNVMMHVGHPKRPS